MTPALTPWFPADVKPVHKGDYQIAPFSKDSPRWSYWNGGKWSFFTINQIDLACHRHDGRHPANIPWRGLASKPSKVTP